MYQLTIRGLTLDELKEKIKELNNVYNNNSLKVIAEKVDTTNEEIEEEIIEQEVEVPIKTKRTRKKKDAEVVVTAPTVQYPPEVVVPTIQQPVIPSAPASIPQPFNINAGHTVQSFVDNFPMILSALITQGKVTQEYLAQLNAYFKVTEIWNITKEQKEEMFNNFVQYGIIVKVG